MIDLVTLLLVVFLYVLLLVGYKPFYAIMKNSRMKLEHTKSRIKVFHLLVGWTILGFVSNLDYTEQVGCIATHENVWSKENVFFSSIAIILISLGNFFRNKQIGILVLITELLFWLFKLFWVKGGYMVGIGAVPSPAVLGFDSVALFLRLLLLKRVSGFSVSKIWLFLTVFLVFALKIVCFVE